MRNILVVESSPRGASSLSHRLSQTVVEKLKAENPGAQEKVHDLSVNPIPHLEEAQLNAFSTPTEKLTQADQQAIRYSEQVIAEVNEADAIVIGLPMYNFSIPSVLKSWIDHLSRAGRTFRYTANGPEGLIKNKKVYLVIASGGVYTEGAMKALDFTEPYLRAVLGFLGMTDVTTFRVEGVAIPGVQESAYEKAVLAIQAHSTLDSRVSESSLAASY